MCFFLWWTFNIFRHSILFYRKVKNFNKTISWLAVKWDLNLNYLSIGGFKSNVRNFNQQTLETAQNHTADILLEIIYTLKTT